MKTEDYKPFAEMLKAIYELKSKEFSAGAIKLWWNILRGYDLDAVSQAESANASLTFPRP